MLIKKVIKTTLKKGMTETLSFALKIFSDKILSIIKITFLKVRGYDIDYSVLLRGHNFFFQSTKHAICINSGTTIGQNTRISGGGDGKIYIDKNVLIDDFTYIMAHGKITIGKNTKIAAFCFITDFNHIFKNTKLSLVSQGYETRPVIVGENVWIGTHVVVLPGVKIGNRAVIGAGSVVTKDVPANSVAVGNPARVIQKIK